MSYQNDDLLTVAETIKELRIHRSTWQKLAKAGNTPPVVRMMNAQRIRYGALCEWVKQQEATKASSVVGDLQ